MVPSCRTPELRHRLLPLMESQATVMTMRTFVVTFLCTGHYSEGSTQFSSFHPHLSEVKNLLQDIWLRSRAHTTPRQMPAPHAGKRPAPSLPGCGALADLPGRLQCGKVKEQNSVVRRLLLIQGKSNKVDLADLGG